MEPNQNNDQVSLTRDPSLAPITPKSVTPKKNKIAVLGLMLAVFMPPIGLLLSIIGLIKVKDYDGDGKSISIAGISLSTFMLAAGTTILALYYSGNKQVLVFASIFIAILMLVIGVGIIAVAFKMAQKAEKDKQIPRPPVA